MLLRLMVCKCAVPPTRVVAAGTHVPAPALRTEVRKEPRDLHLFLLLVLIVCSSSRRAGRAVALSLPPPVKALQIVDQTAGRPHSEPGALAHPRVAQEAFDERSAWCKVRTQFRPRVALFFIRGKCEKPLEFQHQRHVADSLRTLRNPDLGENLKVVAEQRSAPRPCWILSRETIFSTRICPTVRCTIRSGRTWKTTASRNVSDLLHKCS